MHLDTSTVIRFDTREESAIAAFIPIRHHDFTHNSATDTHHRGCSRIGMKIPVGMTMVSERSSNNSRVMASGVTRMESTLHLRLTHTAQSGLIPEVRVSPHIGQSISFICIYFSSF